MTEIFQNIREIYDFTPPCAELAPFIEFFSESSSEKCDSYFEKGHASVTMFPSWTPTFYINLTGPYLIDLGNIRYTIGAQEDILILRNGTVTRHNQSSDRIFTVKFYPGGLEAVLGFSQTAVKDRVIRLNRILPGTLLNRLKQPITFEERVKLMQSFFLNVRLHKGKKDHYFRIVQNAIGEYTGTGMRLNTSQVAERLFITSKTINRYFNRVVGLSPKSYFSILRARTALTAMISDRNSFAPWDHGYYDPAHFYKDIHKFTGQKLRNVPCKL